MNSNWPHQCARVLAFALVVLGLAQSAAAQCSLKSLTGAYGAAISGTNYNRGTPWAFVGRFESDGAGAISGTGTHNVKGQLSDGQFSGTYQVAADCSGTATFAFGPNSSTNLRFVIVDSGKRVELMVVDQGTLEVGWATKIVTDESAGKQSSRTTTTP